ncbi:hypothetical protein Hanom_Chr16g01519801 [Helianthus anomalus]
MSNHNVFHKLNFEGHHNHDAYILRHVHFNTDAFHTLAHGTNTQTPITIFTQTQMPTRHHQNRHLIRIACFAYHVIITLFMGPTISQSKVIVRVYR